jgi:hypothetical protein
VSALELYSVSGAIRVPAAARGGVRVGNADAGSGSHCVTASAASGVGWRGAAASHRHRMGRVSTRRKCVRPGDAPRSKGGAIRHSRLPRNEPRNEELVTVRVPVAPRRHLSPTRSVILLAAGVHCEEVVSSCLGVYGRVGKQAAGELLVSRCLPRYEAG